MISTTGFLQSHARPAAILVNELDTSGLHCLPQRGPIAELIKATMKLLFSGH